ncbi:MAG: hypothetical protein IKP17_01080 [Oscillospiraceae bacterium]|nr:hypothetical protein [Oscillospiraceae bacterium]
MKKPRSAALPVVLCFVLFLGTGLGLHLLLPTKEYSENENRYLASAPAFRLRTLFSGDFTADFEDYVTDQFPFRDSWLDLKSRAERAFGKTENNGVFFCREDTLISRFPQPKEDAVAGAVRAVNALAGNTGLPVILALVPSAAEIWADRLPAHADTADQSALIQSIYGSVETETADICAALREHAGEPVYYRTDHHWTTLGAYYGYCAAAEALGLAPQPKERFSPETVSDSFYGTVYSSSGVRWVKPDSMEIWAPAEGVVLTRYDSPEGTVSPVYDRGKLETKDKYSMFLGGNVSRIVIETGNGGGKLLVLRDSYADCMLPFLFAHYSEIHVLDLRYFRSSVSDYAAEQGFDSVLVLYSLSDFLTDTSVSLLAS